MDYKIWLDVSEVTVAQWFAIGFCLTVIVVAFLALLKLWLSRPEPEPMQMDAPIDERLAIAGENLADETRLVNAMTAEIIRLKQSVRELEDFIRTVDRSGPIAALDLVSAKVTAFDKRGKR